MPSTAIRLDHFLQKSGLVATGGQAKLLIQGEEILVNGAVETPPSQTASRRSCAIRSPHRAGHIGILNPSRVPICTRQLREDYGRILEKLPASFLPSRHT
ncbi:MAG: RNA-binding S4 domain-containing protein [Planctomycetaceae bacterium]